jgi:hypothetical protein
MHRYPESYAPRNLAFRQGRVVLLVVKHLGAGGAPAPGSAPADGDAATGDGHPLVIAVPGKGAEPGRPASAPEAQPGAAPGSQPPPGRPADPQAGADRREGTAADPQVAPAPETDRTAQRQPGQGAEPGPNEGGALGKPVSLEETKRVSPPTQRPGPGLAAAAANLRDPGSGPGLPPMPFVRLLSGQPQAGALFDPETLNVLLESYPPKYREQLGSYLKALQVLGEKRDGS